MQKDLQLFATQVLGFSHLSLLQRLSSKSANFGLDRDLVIVWNHSLHFFLKTSPLPVTLSLAVTAVTAQVGHNTQSPVPGTHQQPADKKRQMPLSRSKIRTHRSVFEFHYRSMQIHTHREKHSE